MNNSKERSTICPNCGARLKAKPDGGYMCEYCRMGIDSPKPEVIPKPEAPKADDEKPVYIPWGHSVSWKSYLLGHLKWFKKIGLAIIAAVILGGIGGFMYYPNESDKGMLMFTIAVIVSIGFGLSIGKDKPVKHTAIRFGRVIAGFLLIILFIGANIGGAALGILVKDSFFM